MQQRMFLKLHGVQGESQNPRHFGEIEISTFVWGNPPGFGLGSGGPGKAPITDLTITKQRDKTSPLLWVAYTAGQAFREGVLTIEEFSEWRSVLRSSILELKSILIESMSAFRDEETVKLNFASLKVRS